MARRVCKCDCEPCRDEHHLAMAAALTLAIGEKQLLQEARNEAMSIMEAMRVMEDVQ